MTNLNDQQLNDIEARVKAAEDGWHVVADESDPHRFEIHGDGPTHIAVFGGDPDDAFASYPVRENAEFAAHARTDVPALVAEVRRLRARQATLATLTERWEQVAAMHSAGHPEGAVVDLSPFQREESGKAHGYRKAVSDVREVLAAGRIPHDLMTDAERAAAPVAAVSSAAENGGQP